MKKVLLHFAAILTAVFLIFVAGMFVGRQQTGPVPAPALAATESKTTNVSDEKININTATVDELRKLPGVGDVIANAIVDYRTENGPFERKEDIINIHGIGYKKAKELMPLICLE